MTENIINAELVPETPTIGAPRATRAGMLCFNRAGQVLVVSAIGDVRTWLFPKGHIEAGEASFEAAERECLEETGVRAVVDSTEPLGHTEYMHKGEHVVVEWWSGLAVSYKEPSLMDEASWREIRWLQHDEACRTISFPELVSVLRSALCEPETPAVQ